MIRLQGFGRGLFGGNFHTHNTLYLPPGIDVVCYSNGRDYASGMRYALLQARAGRVVMSVDCTELLNIRHLVGNDDAMRLEYSNEQDILPWDTIRTFLVCWYVYVYVLCVCV